MSQPQREASGLEPGGAASGSDADPANASCWSPSSDSAPEHSISSPTLHVEAPPGTPAPDIGSVTPEQLSYVRSHVDAAAVAAAGGAAKALDDATVARFVTATGGNLPLSVKRLNATLAWRASVKPESVVCRACPRDPRSHYMHLVGYCSLGRPIIYSCLELARNRVFEDNRDHMIQTFEWAVKCMPPGVQQWIWVCDFKGFGAADLNPRLAKLFLDISAEHYPERLGLFLVVDAPSLFGMLWRAISSFVDPKTYKKIRFLPFDAGKPEKLARSALKAEMDLHFDPVTVAWLLREMAENRDKAQVAHKVYNYYSLYEQAVGGELCDGHEHRSCHHGHLAPSAPAPAPAAAAAAATAGGGDKPPAAAPGSGAPGSGADGSGRVHVHATAGGGGRGGGGSDASYAHVAADDKAGAPHNLLGTPALLHTFNMAPELMLPQATASP